MNEQMNEQELPSTSYVNDADVTSTTAKTEKKIRKRRKRFSDDFLTVPLIAKEAQRLEKERLQRLDKNQETDLSLYAPFLVKNQPIRSNEDEQPKISKDKMAISEDDGNDDCYIEKIIQNRPIKKVDLIVLESSSDEEDKNMQSTTNLPVCNNILAPLQPQRSRMQGKRRNSEDYDKQDLKEGRLLINAGKPDTDPDVYVAPHLTHVLQPHQIGGVKFLYDNIIESLGIFNKSDGLGCIIAHSMGLGKSIQAITFVEIFMRITKRNRVIIICPVNVLLNWAREFEKWMPKVDPHSGMPIRDWELFLLGDTVKSFDARLRLIRDWYKSGGVLLMGYEMFRLLVKKDDVSTVASRKAVRKKQQKTIIELNKNLSKMGEEEKNQLIRKEELRKLIREALLNPGPDLVICDEGHRIKNLNTEVTAALSSIRTRRRIVLTGYPLQNNLIEYYCMVEFVRPTYLGSKRDFIYRFEKPIRNGQCIDSTKADIKLAKQRIHVLTRELRGFVQRRTQHLLKKILPESREFILLIRKSPIQHALYRAFYHFVCCQVHTGDASFNPLKAFAICMKIVNHPDLLYQAVLKTHERNITLKNFREEFTPSHVQEPSLINQNSIYAQFGCLNDSASNKQQITLNTNNSHNAANLIQKSIFHYPYDQNSINGYEFGHQNDQQFNNNIPTNNNQHPVYYIQKAQQINHLNIKQQQQHNISSTFHPFINIEVPNRLPYYFTSNKINNGNLTPLSFATTSKPFINNISVPLYQSNNMVMNPNLANVNQQQSTYLEQCEEERRRLFEGTFLHEEEKNCELIKTHQNLFDGHEYSNISTNTLETTAIINGIINNTKSKNNAIKQKLTTKEKEITDLLSDEFLLEDNSISLEWAELPYRNYVSGVLENSSKLFVAMLIITETVKRAEKLLLFSQSIVTLNLIQHFLGKQEPIIDKTGSRISFIKNKTYCRFDGSTSASDREKLITRFNEDTELRLFLISTKAGSLGVNLVSANRVIIFDVSWNPCHDAQAICRIYRYGQKRRTFIYRLIMGNCMEKQIFNRQISKHGLQKRVIDEQQIDANVTSKEVENLLDYNESLDVTSDLHHLMPLESDIEEKIDDDLLIELVRLNRHRFLEAPFLHESLLLESEADLSAAEKLEAELLFEHDKRGINFYHNELSTSLNGTSYTSEMNRRFGFSQNSAHKLNNYHDFNRISHATPLPKHIELASNMQQQQQKKQHFMAMDHGPERFIPTTHQQPFVIDKKMTLPKVNIDNCNEQMYELLPGQRVTIVNSLRGVYLRTNDGIILDATNSPLTMTHLKPLSNGVSVLPSDSNEVIQIDD